ncbi:MAG: glycosyltransferase [Microthrixaceae bacterium]
MHLSVRRAASPDRYSVPTLDDDFGFLSESRVVRAATELADGPRKGIMRLVVVCVALPLLLVIMAKVAGFVHDPVLRAYGMTVSVGTLGIIYLSLVRYKDLGAAPLDLCSDLPKVSFLVAVKNEEDIISDCVWSMVRQDYPNLEILVANDGSTDGTLAALGRVMDVRDDVHVLTSTASKGKKHALTGLVQHATGDILAFTDSDCIAAPDAISRCVAALLADDDYGAVSGHSRALNADLNLWTRMQDVWYDCQFSVSKAAESSFGAVLCVSGPLAVFRREAVWNYFPAWANDRFLGQDFPFATDRQLTGLVLGQKWRGAHLQAEHAGGPMSTPSYPPRRWKVGYVRSARTLTAVPEQFSHIIRQQIRWKKSFLRNLAFNGPYLWRLGPGPATLFYGHALWVVVAPAMAFRHLVWMPLVDGAWVVAALYLAGSFIKGTVWGLVYRLRNSGCYRWVYRPFMSLLSTLVLSWLIVYSAATVRKGVWFRA